MQISAPWPALSRNLVAILRGVRPDEVCAIGEALAEAGFEAIEVPLNSPEPFHSIERLVNFLPAHILTGAGTVVTPQDVERVADVGGRLMVSPNVNVQVLEAAARKNMVTMPGVFSATEAFTALGAGASSLKFFPASVLGVKGIAALRSVLPGGTVIGAVGGISETSFADYAAIGVKTFGMGTSLYRPGDSAQQVSKNARRIISIYDEVIAK
ncbi:2-dehydro-3-deoxy-6-phosphogalactonate aldolase [Entomohabitans teleogrylli]|uniref:2-dehydro-3-deoxy-6-phosphogalactonate aldolase n=1 Tax=Entomohabitans teleogrylli TaxID=1384589 RepID=UPI00073DA13F|nr:2-dehydro-3-deoxy-6-phosphogalactonate aldolase [Entomohabitans teleogrylli]